MATALSILAPPPIATEAFTDAIAAVVRLDEIYGRNTAFLRDRFEAFANGEAFTSRVRTTYPFVRITTSSHVRLDSRLAYGFVAGPGVHETTVTRPDLFRAYLTEQIRLLIENHGVPVEVGESSEPIPVHFAYRRDINIEAVLAGGGKPAIDRLSPEVQTEATAPHRHGGILRVGRNQPGGSRYTITPSSCSASTFTPSRFPRVLITARAM